MGDRRRVLIYDSNVDFARTIAKFIMENFNDCDADIGSNKYILDKRLRDHNYDLIIVEAIAIQDADEVIETLNERVTCPVILWTQVTKREEMTEHTKALKNEAFRFAEKPSYHTISRVSELISK
jgi:DNA-binding NtrC family response regulator